MKMKNIMNRLNNTINKAEERINKWKIFEEIQNVARGRVKILKKRKQET